MDFDAGTIALSAILSAFMAVRIIKGGWMRNPQYLAVSIVGSIVGAFILHLSSAELEAEWFIPTLACFIGSCAAVFIFDQMIGAA